MEIVNGTLTITLTFDDADPDEVAGVLGSLDLMFDDILDGVEVLDVPSYFEGFDCEIKIDSGVEVIEVEEDDGFDDDEGDDEEE
jgi:hypothetical protein